MVGDAHRPAVPTTEQGHITKTGAAAPLAAIGAVQDTVAPPAAYRNPASVLPHLVQTDGEVFGYPTIDNLPSKI